MPKPVFISYSTDDSASAEQIRDGLEAGDGDVGAIACWMAPRDIAPGLEYGSQIVAAIEECAVLVLLLSESSNRSRFVLNEVERAVSKNKIVIPVRIHNVTPSRSLEFFISNAQWIDAWQGPLDAPLESLTAAIRTHLTPITRSTAHPVTPPSPPRHNLPAQTTPFIGRERELAEVARLLADPSIRLLTVVGPGGMGKSRLALEAASAQLANYADGVFFVPLAPLATTEAIVPAIAAALKFAFQADARTPQQQLFDFLRQNELLLLLDNFEHLIEAAGLVTELLQAAPQVKVLTTSRERLRLSGETVVVLGGLEFPNWETPEDALAYNAVKLFMQSSQRARPDFSLSANDLPFVARICRLVDGLPLGILLAAAWVEMLSPREIADEIAASLDFLATDLRDTPERQRSIRAVFEYSWRLLNVQEQATFSQLSIFRGGFTRLAAQEICGASLTVLAALVNKSLLHRSENSRYEVHELLRQYAADKLKHDATGSAAVRNRHAAYYLTYLQQQLVDLTSRHLRATLDEIESDLENVRAGWAWAIEQKEVEEIGKTLAALNHFYELRRRYGDGKADSGAAAKLAASTHEPLIEARALIWQAAFCRTLAQPEQAAQLLEQSAWLLDQSLSPTVDSRRERAALLLGLARLASDAGDGPTARQRFAESIAMLEPLGDNWAVARALIELSYVMRNLGEIGTVAQRQEQLAEAEQTLRQSLAICRQIDYSVGVAEVLMQLGMTHNFQFRVDEAHAAVAESVALYTDLHIENATAQLIFGAVKGAQGDYAQAKILQEMALQIAQKSGHHHQIGQIFHALGRLSLLQGDYQAAQPLLQKSVTICRSAGLRHEVATGLYLLGLAERGLGHQSVAQSHLAEAIRIGIAIRSWTPLWYGLALWALLLAERGESARAAELYALHIHFLQGHSSLWVEDLVGRHLRSLTANLPAETSAAATARGQVRNLWTTAHEILAEIEEAEKSG